jgi:hypothetical protein
MPLKETTILTSNRLKRGCAVAVVGGLAALGATLLYALRIPSDAPLPRMYRTEVMLSGLVRAVEVYQREHGAYPPPGADGLLLVTAYDPAYPAGPPVDAWDHPFQYVPAAAYEAAPELARRGEEGYYSAETFQLYSLGADGVAGGPDSDDITSWDSGRTWRAHYERLHRDYMSAHSRWGCGRPQEVEGLE